MPKRLIKSMLGGALALLVYAQPSQALENDLTVYLWGVNISGSGTLGQQTVPQQPVDVDFDSVLSDLDFGFEFHYEGMGERWGLGLDYTYAKLSNSSDDALSAEVKSALGEVFGIYRASKVFDLLAGVRFAGVDMSLDTPGQASADGDRSLTDFYFGGRARVPLSDKWGFVLRGDIGAGDSDTVWNVVTALDWRVSKLIALRGGYRWLDYNVENNDVPVEASLDMRLDGAFLGVAFLW